MRFREYLHRVAPAALALGTVLVLGACDDDDGLVDIDDDQEFVAELEPLNGSVVEGSATFEMDDGQFTATVGAAGLAPNQTHPQHIHFAAACPSAAADTDGDGLTSVMEGAPAYGLILVPLDSDLTSQAEGTFPQGTPISYNRTVARADLLSSIEGSDPNPDDLVTKLDGENLALETRTVVVHGAWVADGQIVNADTEGAEYMATLPVACGTIEEVI